jgi:3-hydroxybutyryl-CoA dehydratase
LKSKKQIVRIYIGEGVLILSITNDNSWRIRNYEDIALGATASISKTITNEDVHKYASLIDDTNPVHLDPEYANSTMFGKQIAHGMHSASFFTTLIANYLPGLKGIYVSQEIKFLRPVYIGDTVTAQAEVIGKNDEKRRLTLRTTLHNQNGEQVIEGQAVIAVMK